MKVGKAFRNPGPTNLMAEWGMYSAVKVLLHAAKKNVSR